MIVALVMVLGRIEGCSDREAVDRFAFVVRWKYAAGGVDFDYPGFVHTVLVDMRARLARSARPNQIFEVTLDAARAAGLVGRRRVLDSTPLYDAVATMDTRRPAAHPHRTITNSPQNRHQSPARDPTRNAFHSSLENARIGPKGSFESRTSTAAPVMATSTQLPVPLAVLFFHRRGPCW